MDELLKDRLKSVAENFDNLVQNCNSPKWIRALEEVFLTLPDGIWQRLNSREDPVFFRFSEGRYLGCKLKIPCACSLIILVENLDHIFSLPALKGLAVHEIAHLQILDEERIESAVCSWGYQEEWEELKKAINEDALLSLGVKRLRMLFKANNSAEL